MPKMDLPPQNLSTNTESASIVGKTVNSSRLETTEVTLELEERDEFIQIKVSYANIRIQQVLDLRSIHRPGV